MMGSYREFVEKYAEPKGELAKRTAGRIRMAVLARLKGWRPADIAAWLQLSVDTVRAHLRRVGGTINDAHWQHGGFHACRDRLAALGLTDEHVLRTGATIHGDMVYSRDMPLAPGKRWVERQARLRRRWQRRQARLARRG